MARGTYTCGWCKRKGTKICEQLVGFFRKLADGNYEFVDRAEPPRSPDIVPRYVCYSCGQEVFPEP